MPISPIAIATRGYLNSPLSVATRGYLSLVTVGTIIREGPGGGGHGGLQHPKYYTVTPDKLEGLLARLEREDEEIIAIVMAAMEVIQ